jgi:hypothetical protein
MAGKALASVRNALSNLSKLRIVSPFKITGVASDPEFKHYLPQAPDYRVHAPASQPVRAVVPQADPKLVYDIKYWTRDTRRAHMLVGGTNVTELVTETFDPKLPAKRPEGLPPLPGRRHKFSKPIGYLEVSNSGYT